MNLVEDPWIPVLTRSGARELGLREAFGESASIAGICSGDAIVDAALLRLLLAIDAAADGDPGSWLGDHRDRFGLFDAQRPFWQNQEMGQFWELAGAASPASTLSRANFSAETIVHSVSSAVGAARGAACTPAQAARYLVMRQQFSTGGIQSFPTGAAFKGLNSSAKQSLANVAPLVYKEGPTLRATLAASRIPGGAGPFQFSWPEGARPCDVRVPDGVVDTLSWQSRSMLLRRRSDGMVDAYLCCDGIRYGDPRPELLPHTTFEQKRKGSDWTVRAVNFRRPGWRQLLDAYAAGGPGILSGPHTSTEGIRIRIIGLSSFQARLDGYVDDSIPVPVVPTAAAAELSDSVTAAYKRVASIAGSANAALYPGGGGKGWSDKRLPDVHAGMPQACRAVVEEALSAVISIEHAKAELAHIADNAAATLRDELIASYPAAAGKIAARLTQETR